MRMMFAAVEVAAKVLCTSAASRSKFSTASGGPFEAGGGALRRAATSRQRVVRPHPLQPAKRQAPWRHRDDHAAVVELADVLRRFAGAYLAAYGPAIPASHRRAIADIIACRTEALGGHLCAATIAAPSSSPTTPARTAAVPNATPIRPKPGSSAAAPRCCRPPLFVRPLVHAVDDVSCVAGLGSSAGNGRKRSKNQCSSLRKT
jgi:hypothetical protein